MLAAATAAGAPAAVVGQAGGDQNSVRGLFSIPLKAVRDANEAWLPGFMA